VSPPPEHPGLRTVYRALAPAPRTREAVRALIDRDGWRPLIVSGRSEVWRAPPGVGPRLIVKIQHGGGAKDTLRRALGLGPRRRAYGWGLRLAGSGLVEPAVAWVTGRLDRPRGGGRCEATFTPELPGPTLLEALTAEDEAGAIAAGIAAGDHTKGLLAQRVWNRDQKPSNLMFASAGLRLVDLDGLRRGPPPDAPARMLASLLIEPAGVGRPLPEPVIRAIVGSLAQGLSRDPAALRAEAERIVAEHGDPTPARDPLETERRRRAATGDGDTLGPC